MERTPRHAADTRPRAGILIGLAAAAGAFGAAAMMAATTAPTARADDFTDIIDDFENDVAQGTNAFDVASADFGSSDVAGGLTAFFDGVDDDFLSAPENVFVGTIDALNNQPIFDSYFDLPTPTDFAAAVTDAQDDISYGETEFSKAASYLATSDYGGAAELGTGGLNDTSVVPLEFLLIGAVEALGF